jgi:multidrug efflux pump
MNLVERAIRNARLTISVLVFLILSGTTGLYDSSRKRPSRTSRFRSFMSACSYEGISPEDSERLLLRPMETALKSIQGIKKMTATAYQGGGNVLMEFQAGADLDKALTDVRNKVDDARRDLPSDADEPTVNEVNISEFPVLVVTLVGRCARTGADRRRRTLRDRIEEIPGVLDARLQGTRDDLVEVIIDPAKLSSYNLRPDTDDRRGQWPTTSLIAAGSMEGARGPLCHQGARRSSKPSTMSPACPWWRTDMPLWCAPWILRNSSHPERPRASPGWTASPPSRSRCPSVSVPT